ncbi:aspartate--tRNA ligase [Tenuibacillus multivorans]|uniref:Aspartate--tRNA ligase n=1 Tax=Tenuibacillus multivorans TaxID=237069 RepID=A0A1G9ZID8_9BACI|nr:aspartate--tRNA ligase [Tenuibacillus multivorans]GEL77488.1 aspartate--tRNA(Asp/Asn) ligase [Tenuibacillus multivorans]SDN21089.1 aspartyl-tRNA synthetase [Tenuibacillus multivorans]
MESRTHCGLITSELVEQKVLLKGWVQRRRDLGGLIFVDLRDRSGIVQVVFNPDINQGALETAEKLRGEYVVTIEGTVKKRDENTVNPKMKTGEVEVVAERVEILNKSKALPIKIENKTEATEEIRLKYRYLDLRREEMQETMKLRHLISQSFRHYLNHQGFFEMETPMLTKSTPEGARDYLVPSRVHPGDFYALPQSPQLFKQLLMISGYEKYYQITRCFRDEDLRADRQPEFTQLDIETSFMSQEEIMAMTEEMLQSVVKEVKGVDVATPFPRMTYDEAMERYGSDKPDTRFEMELVNVSDVVADSGFKVFKSAVESGGKVSAINVKGQANNFSRKDIDKLTESVSVYGAKGLAWMKVDGNEFSGPIAKFFETDEVQALSEKLNATDQDLLLFVADKANVVADSLGALRLKLGKELGLIDESKLNFLWVTDWPLYEYDEDEGRYHAAHHPFTMPQTQDIDRIDEDPANVKAQAYDVVLNGYELGGGSLRIYQKELQEQMLKTLGFSEEEAEEQFGFLLEALEFGAPPHGGIALGLDRIVMILAGKTNLRDTILFPKTASAADLLTDAPSPVDGNQLDELYLKLQQKSDE